MSSIKWLPLESNPDVMNKCLANLGVPANWGISDVVSMDEELIDMIPVPSLALLLLFPITNKDISAVHESSAQEGQTKAPNLDDEVNLHFIAIVNVNGKLVELVTSKKKSCFCAGCFCAACTRAGRLAVHEEDLAFSVDPEEIPAIPANNFLMRKTSPVAEFRRFVNLTIEAHKDSDLKVATTLIAKGLGIPSYIVDLRNESTHSFSPSLASLRMAAEAALKFLNESFWEKEISTLKNLEKEPLDETNIRGLIYSYITLHFNILKNEDKEDSEQLKQDYDESKIVIHKLVTCIQKNKRQFINILISDGLFIPYDDELKNVMSPSGQESNGILSPQSLCKRFWISVAKQDICSC